MLNTWNAALLLGASTDLADLTNLFLWIARILILLVFGGTGLYKMSKGKNDENPKETNEGMYLLIGAGALFGITFAIVGIF